MASCHTNCKSCEKENDLNSCTACNDGWFKFSLDYYAPKFKCISYCDQDHIFEWDENYDFCDYDESDINEAESSTKYRFRKLSTILQINFTPYTETILSTSDSKNPQFGRSEEVHDFLIVTLCFVFVLFIACIIAVFIIKRRKPRQKSRQMRKNMDIEQQKTLKASDNSSINTSKQNQSFQKLKIIEAHQFTYSNNPIGNGGFSNVYKGMLDDEEVAVKVARNRGRVNIHTELKIFDKTSHPNILPALGVHFGLSNILFMPLRKYSLSKCFETEKLRSKIDVRQLTWFCIQIAEGMNYLHQQKILHCDLKVENILMKDNSGKEIEISDFGCAVDLDSESPPICRGTTTHCSYEILLASVDPEISYRCSKSSDVWSYGITVWQIYSKNTMIPEEFRTREKIIENYQNGKRMEQPNGMPDHLWRYVILRCFDLTPDCRPSMHDLHKAFVREYLEPSDKIIKKELHDIFRISTKANRFLIMKNKT